MMKDNSQGQTHYCAQCEKLAHKVEELQRKDDLHAKTATPADFAVEQLRVLRKKVEELQRHNAMLISELLNYDKIRSYRDITRVNKTIAASSAQSAEWLEAKHREWIGEPVEYRNTCTGDRCEASDRLAQPLYAIPK